jgi:hypothetical protein
VAHIDPAFVFFWPILHHVQAKNAYRTPIIWCGPRCARSRLVKTVATAVMRDCFWIAHFTRGYRERVLVISILNERLSRRNFYR